ncbi:LysR substrate-binding domain-containing protein [Streptomyces sp. H10-C2]|uniref:LysR family transcriptional regulator n=1 Tax=unclassified Streptomyces TaxID=2593676 RepID=UPI0024BBA574|nr:MULTISPECIES: LysR substrate-binding domain-containing protein [unclassified Streptomyces]MDJ0346872.1 LysR substrate-binding domain-containing protein [Streptomyces sp. PH10-H1]MDJ0375180.1 LysR substrate-binding domain-containing protein [Streptomyces sp. H10-C2]
MERYEIEAFLTLAEELHFGRTAERLHVTTARVSQTISKLERRVGVPLFERTSRRVALTAIGGRLRDDLMPAYEQIEAGLSRAISAGRGITGELRIGFVGAAAGQLLLQATDRFRGRHPDCEVRIREVQMGEALERLRADEFETLLVCFPLQDADLTMGPVLLSEPRMLAVSSRHPFARRESVSIEDLSRDKVLQAPCSLPDPWRDARSPRRTPSGRPIESGASAETFQEILTLIGAGHGIFPVGAHVTRYYARPDVAYIPFDDAPPLEWGLVWRTTGATARIRAFSDAAAHTG